MVVISKEQVLVEKYLAAKSAMTSYLEGDEGNITDERTDLLADAEMDAESAIVEYVIRKGNVTGENAKSLRFAAETVAAAFIEKVGR